MSVIIHLLFIVTHITHTRTHAHTHTHTHIYIYKYIYVYIIYKTENCINVCVWLKNYKHTTFKSLFHLFYNTSYNIIIYIYYIYNIYSKYQVSMCHLKIRAE